MKIFISLIIVVLSASLSLAGTRVAVTPFETSSYSLSKYKDFARGELENIILNIGNIEIVERARMDSMQEELAFGNFSGMTDPKNIAQFGKMTGANVLVTGSILKVDTEDKKFSGFGIKTSSSKTIATVRVRAYDIERGSILYSSTVDGDYSDFKTNFGGTGQKDDKSVAIENALKKLKEDQEFISLFASLNSEKDSDTSVIKVKIDPIPGNCDLEINGVYYGSTPADIKLDSGNTVNIKLSKAGYISWERTVAPRPGIKITPQLEKKDL